MPNMIFVNLPVSDLDAAKAFYSALGFTLNEQFSDERTASFVVSAASVVYMPPNGQSFLKSDHRTPSFEIKSAMPWPMTSLGLRSLWLAEPGLPQLWSGLSFSPSGQAEIC